MVALAAPAGASAATVPSVEFGADIGAVYDPADVTVALGGEVVFSPRPGSSFDEHPLVSDEGLFPVVSLGAEPFARRYETPGHFGFHCELHQGEGMWGVVHVLEGVAPLADFVVPDSVPQAAPIRLDAGSSSDPDPGDSVVRYEWDFDADGVFELDAGGQAAVEHTFQEPGSVDVTLRVTDLGGHTSIVTKTVSVAVAEPPPVVEPPPLVVEPPPLVVEPLPPVVEPLPPVVDPLPPALDTVAPYLALVSVKGALPGHIGGLMSTGRFGVRLRSNERATVAAKVRARIAGHSLTLAKGRASVAPGSEKTIATRLTNAGRTALTQVRTRIYATLRLVAIDADGNERVTAKRLTLKR